MSTVTKSWIEAYMSRAIDLMRGNAEHFTNWRQAAYLCTPSLLALFTSISMKSVAGLRGGLTVRPLQPMLGDVFDTDAQGDQFG